MEQEQLENIEPKKDGDGKKTVVNKGQFGYRPQPTPEAKSAGWWRKQKGRKMFRALMQLPADGQNLVPLRDKDGNVKSDKNGNVIMVDQLETIRKQAAEYFNLPPGLITMEMLIFMKQMAKAVQKNDSFAAALTIEQAYGRADKFDEQGDVPKPIINLVLGEVPKADGVDVPPISESETEVEQRLNEEQSEKDIKDNKANEEGS